MAKRGPKGRFIKATEQLNGAEALEVQLRLQMEDLFQEAQSKKARAAMETAEEAEILSRTPPGDEYDDYLEFEREMLNEKPSIGSKAATAAEVLGTGGVAGGVNHRFGVIPPERALVHVPRAEMSAKRKFGAMMSKAFKTGTKWGGRALGVAGIPLAAYELMELLTTDNMREDRRLGGQEGTMERFMQVLENPYRDVQADASEGIEMGRLANMTHKAYGRAAGVDRYMQGQGQELAVLLEGEDKILEGIAQKSVPSLAEMYAREGLL